LPEDITFAGLVDLAKLRWWSNGEAASVISRISPANLL
jgi:hypothetical protein